jgi:hypothetical protein
VCLSASLTHSLSLAFLTNSLALSVARSLTQTLSLSLSVYVYIFLCPCITNEGVIMSRVLLLCVCVHVCVHVHVCAMPTHALSLSPPTPLISYTISMYARNIMRYSCACVHVYRTHHGSWESLLQHYRCQLLQNIS